MSGTAWLVAAGDVRVAAVREALAPFAWRSLTAEAVCRRAVAAIDRIRAGHPDPGCGEERVGALVAFLAGRRWRSLTVSGVSRQLVSAVEAWEQQQRWFDIQLGLLLDDASG